jgi:hypothetical protein
MDWTAVVAGRIPLVSGRPDLRIVGARTADRPAAGNRTPSMSAPDEETP